MQSIGIHHSAALYHFQQESMKTIVLLTLSTARSKGQSPAPPTAVAQPNLVQPVFQRAAATPCGKI